MHSRGSLRRIAGAPMTEPAAPALPAMSISFREEEVDLSLLPEDSRDIDSQAFMDAVFALHQQPHEGVAQEEAH
jgi:hypothetical protein